MKKIHTPRRSFKFIAAFALLTVGWAIPLQAVNVVMSGTNAGHDQPLIDFVNNNFTNITSFQYGNFSDPATIPLGTDVFMVGRHLNSGEYNNATNSATFNALTIPVVSFTSFVSRTNGDRWSWHSGNTINASDASGNETTVTAAGASILGFSAGAHDFHSTFASNEALGEGTVGTGTILATINGNILAAGWFAGEESAGGQVFGGDRLLWNVFQIASTGTDTVLADNLDGIIAMRNAVEHYTDLTAVPEPSTYAAIFGLVGFGAAILYRRRKRSA